VNSGDVMFVCGNFGFHRVIREEINGCISSGRFAEYVTFKVGWLLNNEKVKETCTSIPFVCVWFMYLLIRLGFVRLVSYMFKMSSDIFCVEYYVFCVKKLFDVYVLQVL
jgi:hypothetical protein